MRSVFWILGKPRLMRSTSKYWFNRKKYFDKNLGGFTIFELLLVITIGTLLAIVSVPVFTSLQVSAQLNEAGNKLMQTLRLAQEKSMSGLYDNTAGVYFVFSDEYILYQGDSYGSRIPAYDRVFELGDEFEITTTFGNDITFSRITGEPSVVGDIMLVHQINGVFTITVNSAGGISSL